MCVQQHKCARREDYAAICHELGFAPDIHFVVITNRGTITFSCGRPQEIRALYAAVIRCGYKPAARLQQCVRA